MAQDHVGFTEEGARRAIRAIKAVEAAGLSPDPVRARPTFSQVQMFRITSETPDGDFLYDAVLMTINPTTYLVEDLLDSQGNTIAVKVRDVNYNP